MNFKELLDNQLKEKIRTLIKSGKKIEAVAIVQNQLKIGLKNSKDLVDGLEFSELSQLQEKQDLMNPDVGT